ncbi:MAG: hypothetical protein ACYS9C_01665 [Planctomycetota bacterium]
MCLYDGKELASGGHRQVYMGNVGLEGGKGENEDESEVDIETYVSSTDTFGRVGAGRGELGLCAQPEGMAWDNETAERLRRRGNPAA